MFNKGEERKERREMKGRRDKENLGERTNKRGEERRRREK